MNIIYDCIEWIKNNFVLFITTLFSGVGGLIISKFWDTIFPKKKKTYISKESRNKKIEGNQGLAVLGDVHGNIDYNNSTIERKLPNIRVQLIRETCSTRACKPGFQYLSADLDKCISFNWNFKLTLTNLSSVSAYYIKLNKKYSIPVLISEFNKDFLLANLNESVDVLYSKNIFCRRDQINNIRSEIFQKRFPEEMEQFKLDIEYSDENSKKYLTKFYYNGTEFISEDGSEL